MLTVVLLIGLGIQTYRMNNLKHDNTVLRAELNKSYVGIQARDASHRAVVDVMLHKAESLTLNLKKQRVVDAMYHEKQDRGNALSDSAESILDVLRR